MITLNQAMDTATRYPHVAVVTAYHGGGILSRHKTIDAASRAVRRYAGDECTCGCACVYPTSDLDTLRDSHDTPSPYSPAL